MDAHADTDSIQGRVRVACAGARATDDCMQGAGERLVFSLHQLSQQSQKPAIIDMYKTSPFKCLAVFSPAGTEGSHKTNLYCPRHLHRHG